MHQEVWETPRRSRSSPSLLLLLLVWRVPVEGQVQGEDPELEGLREGGGEEGAGRSLFSNTVQQTVDDDHKHSHVCISL